MPPLKFFDCFTCVRVGGQPGDLVVNAVQTLRADAPPLQHKAH